MKAKAFTLVELLVVIAIIALLMAILMPALQRARMQAKHVICKANLKTYGLVMTLYISDYDDRLPESYTGLYSLATMQANPSLVGVTPDGTYIPYLRTNVKSSICGVFADVYHQKHSDKPKPVFTYSFNWWLNADKPIIPRVSMVRASETFFAGEEGVWHMNDENGLVNGSIMNDNSLCTRWDKPSIVSLSWVKGLNAVDFPPSPSKKFPYTDAFGEYHRIPLRKIYSAMKNEELTGGVSVAVLVDGSVTDVTPYDTFKYAVGGL